LTPADRLFVFVACGVIPAASLVGAFAMGPAIANADLAYAGSIVKWSALGAWALALARRRQIPLAELYLDFGGSYLRRRPGSALAIASCFVVVALFALMPRFYTTWTTLGLPVSAPTYLHMPATPIGVVLGTLCAFCAAAGSEIVYRGYLRVLAERYFRTWWVAALVISAVFGWAHSFYGLYGTVYTAVIGFGLALVARGTRCLYTVILTHMLFDLAIFLKH
jgi:membrane protease YdiL (CAAX protease family)